MSKYLTKADFDKIAKLCIDNGLKVRYSPGWAGRCRCHNGPHYTDPKKVRAWEETKAIYVHHTGGPDNNVSDDYIDGFLAIRGQSKDVPGPLCQFALERDCVTFVAVGRANHAGQIAANSAAAVKAGKLPTTNGLYRPGPDAYDGNVFAMGIEAMENGSGPWDATLYKNYTILVAAICIVAGLKAGNVIGHREATRRKDDPSFDMGKFRRDVETRIKAMTGKTTSNPSPKPPVKPKVVLDLSDLAYAANTGKTDAKTKPMVIEIQRALVAKKLLKSVTGSFDKQTLVAFSNWQKSLDYKGSVDKRGSDADGRPGNTSLNKLMKWWCNGHCVVQA